MYKGRNTVQFNNVDLRKLIKSKGCTIQELALKVNVSDKTIYRALKSGRAGILLFLDICDVLKIAPDLLSEDLRGNSRPGYSYWEHSDYTIYCGKCHTGFSPRALFEVGQATLPNYCPICGSLMQHKTKP